MPEGEQPIPQPINEEAGELVECYWALDLMQAKFLADKLSEAGIPAVADTHDMHDALGSMSSSPRVWVRAAATLAARLDVARGVRTAPRTAKSTAGSIDVAGPASRAEIRRVGRKGDAVPDLVLASTSPYRRAPAPARLGVPFRARARRSSDEEAAKEPAADPRRARAGMLARAKAERAWRKSFPGCQ